MEPGSIERLLLSVVETAVRELRQEALAPPSVTLESSLDRDLGLNSLSRMELLLRVERTCGVDLPEDTLSRAETVRDLLAALRRASPAGARLLARPAQMPAMPAAAEQPGAPVAAGTLLDMLDWHLLAHADRIPIEYLADERQESISYRELAAGAGAIAVLGTTGEPADEIVLAPPDSVLKTSSGKVRRSACRAAYEDGRIGPLTASARVQAARLALGALALRLRCALTGPFSATYATVRDVGRLPAGADPLAADDVHLDPGRCLDAGPCRGAAVPARGVRPVQRARTRALAPGCALRHRVQHASYTDGILLVAALPRPFSSVVKRELQGRFLVGRYLARLGAEFVERADVRLSVEDANRIAEAAASGRALIVFPESTFVARPGLLPFFLGAFLAAARARLPVVPVAIRGSRTLLPDGSWRLRRSSIAIEIGEPIPTPAAAGGLFAAAAQLRRSARAEIAHLLEGA